MPQGIQKPTNRILAHMIAGQIEEYEVGANATAAEMIAGACVVLDTVNYAVKEAGDEADHIDGVLEVSPDNVITDTCAVGEHVQVLKGHFIAQIRLKASENVSIGTILTTGGDGLFKILAVGTIGAQGVPCAKALEASNVAAIVYILAEVWTSAAEAAAAA